ncbi:MAG: hypothetical protein LUG98_00440 [Tannerellaceae bacterium]|nr:hypothetical protein [Tannerellaceae bacterium]
MKIKSLFFAGAVLLAALTGCNKEEGGAAGGLDPNGESNVFFKLSEGTKADAAEIVDGTGVTFTDGIIYFVDGSNQIVKQFTVGQSGAQYSINALKTSGVIFTGIPNTASDVYIIGNHDFSTAASTTTDMSVVLAEITDLTEQVDNFGGVEKATLYGSGPLYVSSSTEYDKEANVIVNPLIGRIEIMALSTDPDDSGLDQNDPEDYVVASYELEGIYINNFYYQVGVHGNLINGVEPHNFGKIFENYDNETAGGQYLDGSSTADWRTILFDQGSPLTTAVNGLVEPTNDAWAYNIFSAPNELPRIVLKLTNVKVTHWDSPTNKETIDRPNGSVTDGSRDGIAFLTVQKYMDIANANAELATLEAGHIYKIEDLAFTADDLTDLPEEKVTDPDDEFKVFVQVEMLPWKAVYVEGGF